MPHTIKGWTITGGRGCGTIASATKCIEFGTALNFKNYLASEVIDLRGMEHSGEDTFKVSVTGFKAAGDLLNEKLAGHDLVAIHCHNGRSRTSFSLISYFVAHQGFSYDEAAELMTVGQAERTDAGRFDINAKNTAGNSYSAWVQSPEGLEIIQNNDADDSRLRRTQCVKSGYTRKGSDKSVSCVMANVAKPPPSGLITAQAVRQPQAVVQDPDPLDDYEEGAAQILASLHGSMQ